MVNEVCSFTPDVTHSETLKHYERLLVLSAASLEVSRLYREMSVAAQV